MKLGFVSAILPDQSLDEVLGAAAAIGYDCVEVMCWPPGGSSRRYAGVCHIDCVNFGQAQADGVRALCEKHGVEISGLGYYPNILSGNAEESQVAIEQLKRVIDAAKLLGLKNVNTFIGNDHTQHPDLNFARFKEVWPELIRYVEGAGVYLGIENCPMLFSRDEWPGGKNLAYSPSVWRKMFETIPSKHFGLNYDPSHLVLQRMDYIEPLREFKDRLFHMHAKDMKIERHILNDRGILAMGWATPKVPGFGDIDWNRFVSTLTDIGYDGPICVEVEDRAFEHGLEARHKSLQISYNVLSPIVL